MNKKQYITPSIEEYRIQMQGMLAASQFDATSTDPQIITPSGDEHNGGFGAPELYF